MNKEWWKNAVIYQVYPKSFFDTNDDGIGDLKGIDSKLDYLKELGVDALWISPCYLSPQIDNGYDIADYRKIDPMFGDNSDLEKLMQDAHSKNIKIIMDMVANHTSDKSVWFEESRKSKDNYFSDFYIWRDPKEDGSEPNNWGSNFGGSAWTYDSNRKQYYLHYYGKQQPDLNWENPKVRQAIYDVMRYWKAHGVDGWRMDVITSISKNQDFPNNPNPHNLQYVVGNQNNGPRMHEFIHEMNQEVFKPFSMMSVGEAPDSKSKDARLLVEPDREELNMVFTFEHMHVDRKPGDVNGRWAIQPVDIVQLKKTLSNWQNTLDGHGWNALYFENHDRARTPSRWGNDTKYRYESATAFATVLHGLKGTPFVYQGEEIGMTNPHFELEDYEDIELKTNYDKLVKQEKTINDVDFLKAARKISRDNARTPMQWDDSKNAGFTKGKPWFKLNPNYKELNVSNDLRSDKSVFKYYQELIKLRHEEPILKDGTFELLLPDDKNIFMYTRTLDDKQWLVIANLSSETQKVETLNKYVDFKTVITNYDGKNGEILGPYEARILKK
ncbi:glycoside hydrolase family 13 protein [Companilactobacillus bobalius]|uniref:Alpha,alpha-phosphotrehalase n=2 Tax=Companilactobacillus bobalius TaxID=2801451 RepID=A0A202FAM5_9LACO|nr:alpha-glucosidase [Companilactobacillus bobalius]GEO59383.1 oligo-1,6-glucosidase 1 [Companilactobacillus paralimentarius]KAE9560040.1 glucohydrolase [Companilactobacillus bobalius]KAE9564002.1 glucohydrolase [Companilactobacillus bobalius]KRK81405.1 oligo-1,6-glucosidase (Sucrase-isomaltase) [Companilactobacillus bobalius DSM 19674]OVE97478.1 Alpha,alpha-phosphotrehalase [Companilactobacillus bobalius]